MEPTPSQVTSSGSCFAWGKKRCIDGLQAGGLSRIRYAAHVIKVERKVMKDSLKIALGIIIGVLGSAACCIGAFFVLITVILAPTSIVTPTETFPATPSLISPVATATPTPLPAGETWIVDNLAIGCTC